MIRQRTARRSRYLTDMQISGIVLLTRHPVRLSGRCTSISETGLGCYLSVSLSPGELIRLDLRLADTPIQTVAEIRYESDGHYGLEFIGLRWEKRDTIIRYCRRLPIKLEEE